MTYECMTPDELALWKAGAEAAAKRHGFGAQKPCTDCPMAFRLAEYEAGRCCLPRPVSHAVMESRRVYKREWMRLKRAREAA